MKPALIALLLLLPALAPAAEAERLAELRQHISQLEQALRTDINSRDSAQAALRDIELKLARLNREQRQLRQRREQAAQRLVQFEQRQQQLAQERGLQLDWVTKTARVGYMNGRQELLRLLLNQQQPDAVARLLRYQEQFQRARHDRVTRIAADLDTLLLAVAETEQARQALAAREAELARQRQTVDQARDQRNRTLQTINARIGANKQRLQQLRDDARRLDALLNDVRDIGDIPMRPSGEPFGKLANKLPWPAARRIRARFGSPREGSVRWNGVILDVPAGSPVRAIHPGRIVFADWLRGYGLLMIIDHGDDFMTLYGQNEMLLREVGEWVTAGDLIARVGDSGGQDNSGLYFEIRRAGKPVNPDKWCNSRVTLPPIASRMSE